MNGLSRNEINAIWEAFLDDKEITSLFVGNIFFHVVEANVEVTQAKAVDPLELFVLQAIEFASPAKTEHINEVLHLGRQVLYRLLEIFVQRGHLSVTQGVYQVTPEGERVLKTGQETIRGAELRSFVFLDPTMRFLNLEHLIGRLLKEATHDQGPRGWKFEAKTLDGAINETRVWKQKHGFPTEVLGRVVNSNTEGSKSHAPAEISSQPLIADIAKYALCVLAVSENDSGPIELTAYPINRKDFSVMKEHSLFHLSDCGEIANILGVFRNELTEGDIEDAWLSLAQDRMLELADQTEANWRNDRLVVSVPVDLLVRWRDFVAEHFERDIIWTVNNGDFVRLCRIQLVGADDASTKQLDYLRCLVQLRKHEDQAKVLDSGERLISWFRQELNIEVTTTRQIADIAFQLGEHQLSYAIAELEDMIDAAI